MQKKIIFTIIILISLFAETARTMGQKPPQKDSPGVPPKPAPPTPVNLPQATGNFQELTTRIDRYFSRNELQKDRTTTNSNEPDQCVSLNKNQFSDGIRWAVQQNMKEHVSQLTYISSAYGLPKNAGDFYPVSLISHSLCPVSSASLNTTLVGKNLPSPSVIAKLNRFVDYINSLRNRYQQGDANSYEKLELKWSQLMMCLAYTESLTTADLASSQNVASKIAPAGYRKPAGVKFYDDPAQDNASRYNIGLFQFTPTASGNIQACIRQWNLINGTSCQIAQNGNQASMVYAVGSSSQVFNAFCGASKITGMFSVQVNSNRQKFTHPNNILSTGELKLPHERCVSLNFAAGRSYNHFGPLQNSTGKNLNSLFDCLEKNSMSESDFESTLLN